MTAPLAHDLLARYWGKADREQARLGSSHHTVLGHCLDVAACAVTLIERNPVLREQLCISLRLSAPECAPTVAAFVAIHDVGKLDTRFQRKAADTANLLRPSSASVPGERYDHGAEGFRLLEADDAGAEVLRSLFGEAAVPLLRAVCGHHGQLPTRDEPAPRAHLPRELQREDSRARVTFLQVVAGFFRELGGSLPWNGTVSGPLVQRIAGLCAVVDWLGSNVDYFPYSSGPVDPVAYWRNAIQRAERACAEAGLMRAPAVGRAFSDLFPGYSPRDVQLLTERVQADLPALVIVEAEMGKGKTEAALALSAKFLAAGACDGIFVGLPTMATSNAMFRRVEQVAPLLFPGQTVQLTLAHGRARRSPLLNTLVQRAMVAGDLDAPEATVSCARWLLGKKRVLLAQMGVGTIDQALQAALVVRHQFVRLFGLSRNVVIVDEVHAYDAYMEVLLEHLLSWLGALRVPVILLSATLPSERRSALIAAWRGGLPMTLERESDISASDASSAPYPLVTIASQEATRLLAADDASHSRTLSVRRESSSGDERMHTAAVVQQLVRQASAGGRVVWIRNTVAEAQRAFDALAAAPPEIERLLFHARFRGIDRSKIEDEVLERFGKNAPPGGRILIATQVVEQSLDLDFDEMHTDLAPIDLLFQRAGRLHRHQRDRLPDFVRPVLVVHCPSDDAFETLKLGPSAYVYDAATLWIADRTLRERETLEFPRDIRPLVEQTYHGRLRAAALAASPRLLELEEKRGHELEARRAKARRCCIQAASAEPDGDETLPDDDDTVQAFTRDGASVTLLPFWWDGRDARGLDADANEQAWQLDLSSRDAWRLADTLLDQTLSLSARRSARGSVGEEERPAFQQWLKRFGAFAEATGLGDRVVPLPLEREGDAHAGWVTLDHGRKQRVLYTRTMGLWMPPTQEMELER
jgi:CRISPR-associated endonuclease/helicase Cas3